MFSASDRENRLQLPQISPLWTRSGSAKETCTLPLKDAIGDSSQTSTTAPDTAKAEAARVELSRCSDLSELLRAQHAELLSRLDNLLAMQSQVLEGELARENSLRCAARSLVMQSPALPPLTKQPEQQHERPHRQQQQEQQQQQQDQELQHSEAVPEPAEPVPKVAVANPGRFPNLATAGASSDESEDESFGEDAQLKALGIGTAAKARDNLESLEAQKRASSMAYQERVLQRWNLVSDENIKKKFKNLKDELDKARKIPDIPPRFSAMSAALFEEEELSCIRRVLSSILSNWVFDSFMAVILLTNILTIGVESAITREGGVKPTFIKQLEYVFVGCYSVELLCNLFLHGLSAFRFVWFQLDVVGLAIGVVEMLLTAYPDFFFGSGADGRIAGEALNNNAFVKVFRLARIARAFRLLVHCQPLYILLQGMVSSLSTLLWTFVIMASLIYIFTIIGVELITQDLSSDATYQAAYRAHFASFGEMMLTLMRTLTLDGAAPIYIPIIRVAPWLSAYFVLFILIAAVALMNLVTAVLVETARQNAKSDAEARKAAVRARARQMIPQLADLFLLLDKDGSGEVELKEILNAPAWVKEQLTAFANRCDIEEIFDLLDYDSSGSVNITEFIDGIMRASDDGMPLEIVRIMKVCLDMNKTLSEVSTILTHAPEESIAAMASRAAASDQVMSSKPISIMSGHPGPTVI